MAHKNRDSGLIYRALGLTGLVLFVVALAISLASIEAHRRQARPHRCGANCVCDPPCNCPDGCPGRCTDGQTQAEPTD